MKKISSTSSTSIIEIKLISGSSRWRGRGFISARRDLAAFVQRVDELHGLFFHAYHQALDLASQKTISDQRGYRDGETRRGRNQRLADAAGQYPRIADAVGRDGVERMDDARHRSQEAEQRRNRRDRAQRVQKSLQFMHHVAAAVLEPLHHQRARFIAIGESDGQKLAERRILLQGRHQFVAELIGLDPVPDFLRQVARYDAAALQSPKALQYDSHRRDGT